MSHSDNSIASTPTCSVVVCTRNRPEALTRCLEALAQLTYPHVDVVVVDNAPSDRRTQAVAERWGTRYLVEPVAGLSRARNTGALSCSSDIVAFTDDDAVPEPHWLSRLVDEFRDPAVTVVTGPILPLDGNADDDAADLGPHRISLNRSNPLWFEMAYFGGIGNGGNMAFRRRVFDVWGGFDERLGRGAFLSDGEEHRAFAQLIERGHTVAYAPDAVVRHPVPETPEERRAQYLRSVSDLAGLLVFLFLLTRHRWRVTRYAIEGVLGTKRTWRFQKARSTPDLTPRSQVLLACLMGPWRCLQACLRTNGRPHVLSRNAPRTRAKGEAAVLAGRQPVG